MVCEMNLIDESAYWPGVARLRLGLNDGEEPRWRPRHTVGMPRKTRATKPGREVKAVSMCRAISIGEVEKKAADGNSHVAFTPFPIDFQAVCGSWCQFLVWLDLRHPNRPLALDRFWIHNAKAV